MRLQPSFPKLLSSVIAVAALAAMPFLASAATVAGHNKINNGSFETGDFSGWTLGSNTGFTGVQCPGAGFVPDGNCSAFLGPVGGSGVLSQTFATAIGGPLGISFVFQGDGGIPSSFLAEFISGSTTTLLSLTDAGTNGTFNFSGTVVAGATTSTLRFTFRDDPGFQFLDNVQVVPEPTSVALVGLALAGLAASRRRKTA